MKKIFLILISFSFLFLSSCIKMNSNLVINDDLSVNSITTFDYTQLNATSKGFSSSFSTSGTGNIDIKEAEKKLPCDNIENGTGGLTTLGYKEVKCKNIDDNIAKVTAKGLDINKFIKEKDGNYILDLKGIIESNSSDKKSSEAEKIQSLNMLKTMGFEMNYNIVFPSDIIESNIGKIDGKKLSYSIYDTIDENNPIVIFKKNGNIKELNNYSSTITILSKAKLFKQLILSKKELEKTYEGRKYKNQFDKYILLMKDKKLIDIYNKLDKADLNTFKLRKYKNILEYLNAKIGLELYKRGLNN